MSSLHIRTLTLAEALAQPHLPALLQAYGEESALQELEPAEMQTAIYQAMEANGCLHLLAAFDGDDMVGLLALIVSVLPHYGKRVASTESFFVSEDARKTGAGLALLRAAEKHAQELGAVGLMVSAALHSRLARVMWGLDYRPTHRVYFKELGR